MNWTEAVDIYCERLGPGFWAEPVNAVSNAAFVLVGLAAWYRARAVRAGLWVEILCLWVAVIGVGSFLFHTFANRWSGLADVLPIWSFTAVYVVFTLRRVFRLRWRAVAATVAGGLAVVALAMALLPEGIGESTNGATQYVPALIALAGFAAAFLHGRRPGAGLVLAACLVFVLSLSFRSVDMAVCGDFPLGTHFLWHLLNATMLGLLLAVALRHGRPAVSP